MTIKKPKADIQSTKQSTRFMLRCSPAWLQTIDHWRRRHPERPTRSETIRNMVTAGMKRPPYSFLNQLKANRRSDNA